MNHCAVHNCTGHSEAQCWRSALDPDDFTQCEMRPALVLLRDEEGNWPDDVVEVVGLAMIDPRNRVRNILDALAAASKEGGADPNLPSAADVFGILRDET